ncbi:MAG: hypothetical protein KAR38_04485, partial [Calditrichia bacterium]|nr:hypothetical protein [Calditrichia bacterium]
LNQPDPQPRERDYSYVGSFFAYAIWIGLGVMAVFQWLKTLKIKENKLVGIGLVVLLLIISPIQMLAKDFYRQNRAGNYLAWDHSYNMLESCPPNAILFTFGDNDTFPVWYLQEVENIRTDVRIVNLQLLNTEWYIYQLKHLKPKVPMNLSDNQIKNIQKLVFNDERLVFKERGETKDIKIRVPKDYQLREYLQKINQLSYMASELPVDTSGYIEFKLKSHIRSQGYGFLRVQDYMILHIIHASQWKRPICFSFTMPPDEMLDGMRNYLQVDGLIYKLTSQRGWAMNEDRVADLFENKFKFRSLNDKNVHYLNDQKALIRNYWGIFHKMNSNLISSGKIDKAKTLLEKMHKEIDIEYLPFNYRTHLFDLAQKGVTGIITAEQLVDTLENSQEKLQISSIISEIYFPSDYAENILKVLWE